MRGINHKFTYDLQNGELKQFLDLVKNDSTLDLEIREDYISIYYRGGCIYIIDMIATYCNLFRT